MYRGAQPHQDEAVEGDRSIHLDSLVVKTGGTQLISGLSIRDSRLYGQLCLLDGP